RATVSVPLFNENFDLESGMITNDEIKSQLQFAVNELIN
ncbi:MAG: hypothetical protein ACI96P_002202, partial [Candidatus Azotimanducaceae bacterium]